MPPFKPTSRGNLIKALRKAGFSGPHSGGKHQFMLKENLSLTIPNPHKGDIGRDLLKESSDKPISQKKNLEVCNPNINRLFLTFAFFIQLWWTATSQPM